MKLNDIDLKHGALFSCECRVRKPIRKTAITGTQYLAFTIEDSNMSIKANIWSENYNSTVNFHDKLAKKENQSIQQNQHPHCEMGHSQKVLLEY